MYVPYAYLKDGGNRNGVLLKHLVFFWSVVSFTAATNYHFPKPGVVSRKVDGNSNVRALCPFCQRPAALFIGINRVAFHSRLKFLGQSAASHLLRRLVRRNEHLTEPENIVSKTSLISWTYRATHFSSLSLPRTSSTSNGILTTLNSS